MLKRSHRTSTERQTSDLEMASGSCRVAEKELYAPLKDGELIKGMDCGTSSSSDTKRFQYRAYEGYNKQTWIVGRLDAALNIVGDASPSIRILHHPSVSYQLLYTRPVPHGSH